MNINTNDRVFFNASFENLLKDVPQAELNDNEEMREFFHELIEEDKRLLMPILTQMEDHFWCTVHKLRNCR